MKHLSFWTAVLLVMLCGAASAQEGGKRGMRAAEAGLPPGAHELQIGEAAPDFSLPGVDGKTYSLADFKDADLLMVIFTSNHCPYCHAMEGRLARLIADMQGRGLAVVAINPNHADAIRIDELGYSKYNDTFDEMKLYAKERGFSFPYLYDGDQQVTAKAYGCLATPHVFLFDRQRKLRYKGRFDDSRFPDPATVTSPDARNAVEALLAGKPVPVEVTRPQGCSTKWASDKPEVVRADEQWRGAPVPLATIDAAGVAALARNDTQKLRLINVWATWCVPCVQEFPGLVSLSRRLGNRDFELITISVDDPKDQAKVQQFLDKQHVAIPNRVKRSLKSEGRTTNNYLFTGANAEALLKALDPEAPGPVPYTAVIAPGGKIVYRHAGEVTAAALQTKLIEELGPYYK
ncbi:MAG TPA: redoxin domain-containing protein [Candidatus Acidoferrum sp.]|nr:redoxin domain-containing protein [Candidatus Acidoferrum sp.]